MVKSVQTGAAPGGAGKGRTDSKPKTPKLSSETREYLAEIGREGGLKGGRKGGQARVAKGFSMRTPAERKALGKRAARARWGKKKIKAGK